MQAINSHLRQASVAVTGPAATAVDRHRRKLRRIFSNGSFDSGGRLYGGFWIDGMKAEDRVGAILIDRQPVAELDYEACALRILYGLAQATPPAGDLYAIRGLGHAHRDTVKSLLSALTFVDEAGTRDLAPLARKLCPDIRPPIDGGLEAMADRLALDRVLGHVHRHHAPIASVFPSIIGHRVQRIESDIMVRVLLMLIETGITALPIHDAVLVRHDHVDEAKAVMAAAFAEIAGVPGVVRRR